METIAQRPPAGPPCVACVGDGADPATGQACLRCKGSRVDPDPLAPASGLAALADRVDQLAERVAQATTIEAIFRRASLPATAGEAVARRARHLRAVDGGQR